jgi:hypothetical protein
MRVHIEIDTDFREARITRRPASRVLSDSRETMLLPELDAAYAEARAWLLGPTTTTEGETR